MYNVNGERIVSTPEFFSECFFKKRYATRLMNSLCEVVMLPISSYHDVYVEIDAEKVRFSDLPFNMILQLTRTSGWELWRTGDGLDDVIAGEFHGNSPQAERLPFRLWFGDNLVFDNTGEREASL
ncbi:hypothetical protein M8C85_002909 [Salmonella enterica]|nr:hypothetical protein [Salmonella bongori]EBV6969564.1 hypothetical protein [Salmonella enterica subsp. enterica serovar Gaminara]ECB6674241.1 hypothetical protein [Salmonella enterica subsp. enterica serovar Kottbus]ECO0312804.1 hypothetical protein [Salmonella enterica subsp. enterica serovar Schwarzengrund]ECZ0089439.1 hypothetical protein [Salmonella enterica subsp. enterica serovar Miami]EDA4889146.1 hypothetical protein [Salmonella enterica subsp. enterica serovar Abony]EDP8789490.1 h